MSIKQKSTGLINNTFRSTFLVHILTTLTGIIGSVVDGMVTGKYLGETSMAAFGFTTVVTLIISIAGSVLSTGSSLINSKKLGEGNLEDTRRSFSACLTMTVITTVFLAFFIFLFAKPAAILAGADGILVQPAVDYIKGYAIASPAIILFALLMPILQMDGERNKLLLSVVVMTSSDIVLDFLNALVLHKGMFGMALATAISYYASLIILIPHFLKKNVIFSRPKPLVSFPVLWQMVRGGLPTGSNQLGRLIMSFVINRYLMFLGGAPAVAANAVILSAGHLCLIPGTAISSTTQIFAGVFYGEEDRKGLESVLDTALRYAVLVDVALVLLFELFASPVIVLFYTQGAEGLSLAVAGFRLYALCMPFYGMNIAFRAFSQGTGQQKETYIITFFDGLIGPLICAFLLGQLWGLQAVWLCYALGESIVLAVIIVAFRRRNPNNRTAKAVAPIPKEIGNDVEAEFQASISDNDLKETADASIRVKTFCKEHKADNRTAFFLALSVEESCGNIIERGFADGKPHQLHLRILKKKGEWILRLRDDCEHFDPIDYMEQFSDDDPASNIGLKVLRGISKEMTYLNTLKLNNLIVKI